MRSSKLRKLLMIAVVPTLAIASLAPSATIGVAAGNAAGSTHMSKMIVILRNQNHGLSVRSARARSAVRVEQAPIIAQLHSAGARDISSIRIVNAVTASISSAEARSLAANPAVAQVIPDSVIPGPSPVARPLALPRVVSAAKRNATRRAVVPSPPCGTSASPELDPEALQNINAVQAQALGFDGAGVKVAFIADGVDPTNPDFQRNAAYASSGSATGSPVISSYQDFSGDGTSAPTPGAEAFGDASSIAAQGNSVYDLSQFVSSAHPLPTGCDIKIVGVAPGANVLALKVFGAFNDTTTSGFLQAIDYAVANGVKVINESFGSNNIPDTALDVTRVADDAAVAAGVTVVVSSGDAGITSTIGSPATDPNVISVGASTTFRSYEQNSFGGINDPNSNGQWADNNISSLSSGGYSQAGNTVDLVAPGDLNWALCSSDTSHYAECTNENGHGSDIQQFGGTSESAPLTAGASADVIQAYASSHGGTDPSPALVKQILMSTATDINAPATEQGAGLLNVLGAVKEAQSLPGTTATPSGGLLVGANQINVRQGPGTTSTHSIKLTNTGTAPVNVSLSTRALTNKVADQNGTFCLQPGTPTASCPAPTGAFQIWSGVTEVYQEEHFTVPSTSNPSRLEFAADYQYTGQGSLLHFALLEPDGTYAAYSLPQGLGDYGEVEVANPPAGQWTAVFFTEKDGATPGGVGTSGPVQWDASTLEYAPGDKISPTSVTIPAGGNTTASLQVTSPSSSGDSSESVVVSTPDNQTTIPVTVRTNIPITQSGGTFSGVLTGGNGRAGAYAQSNSYAFNVPAGRRDVEASIKLANDPGDTVLGFLVDPNGQTVGYSSNDSTENLGTPVATIWMNLYHASPQAGTWHLVLEWSNPVTGMELSEPFKGAIHFNRVKVSSNLPQGHHAPLMAGKTYKFHISVNSMGIAPESFFVDPRLSTTQTISLPDQNGSATNMSLPLPPGLTFPYFFVPTHTSEIKAGLTGSVPVTFDLEYFPGDPDVSPAIGAPGVSESQSGDTASLNLSEPEVSPGFWLLNPDEIGPYSTGGAPAATASATFGAVTQAFDPTITSSTGDFWSAANGLSKGFNPVYVPAGDAGNMTVTIKPTGKPGSHVSGTIYVDDYALASTFGVALPNGDDVAAIPYKYKIG